MFTRYRALTRKTDCRQTVFINIFQICRNVLKIRKEIKRQTYHFLELLKHTVAYTPCVPGLLRQILEGDKIHHKDYDMNSNP